MASALATRRILNPDRTARPPTAAADRDPLPQAERRRASAIDHLMVL